MGNGVSRYWQMHPTFFANTRGLVGPSQIPLTTQHIGKLGGPNVSGLQRRSFVVRLASMKSSLTRRTERTSVCCSTRRRIKIFPASHSTGRQRCRTTSGKSSRSKSSTSLVHHALADFVSRLVILGVCTHVTRDSHRRDTLPQTTSCSTPTAARTTT